jgi:hypothetical protein
MKTYFYRKKYSRKVSKLIIYLEAAEISKAGTWRTKEVLWFGKYREKICHFLNDDICLPF